jgi:MFS family permease
LHAPPSQPSIDLTPSGDLGERQVTENPGLILRTLLRLPTFQGFLYPEYRLLWYGQVANALAHWMDRVAQGWLMYELTNSAVQLGAVTAIRAVPLLFLSPLAGTLADRGSRKTQLVIAEAINALLYAFLTALVVTGQGHPWHLYAVAIGSGIVQVFHGPARQAMISEAVDPRDMTNAIGLSSVAFNGSRMIGPAIAGILIAVAGTGSAYIVETVLFALTTLWTIQVTGHASRPVASSRHGPRPSFMTSMVEGWRFVRHNPTIRAGMMVLMLGSFFAVPFSTLLPIFAKDILDVGSAGQGFLLTGMGVGALSSSVLIASLGNRLPRGRVMVGAAFCYGSLLVLFAASQWIVVSMPLMVLIGLANVMCNALVQTVVQAHAPSEIRGRIMAVYQQRDLSVTAGSMLIGALAAAWGAPQAVAAMGAACAVGAAAIWITIPHVRTIR